MRHFLFLVLFVLAPFPVLAADAVIGTFMEIEGAPVVRSVQGAVVPARVEGEIRLGDRIATGPGGRVLVLFIDDTELTLSENTELVIDSYVFDPENPGENKAVYDVLRGAFFYVSGLIAKKPDPDVTVRTPYGAIGVRGTQFWGGDIDGEYGVLVNDGQVEIAGREGSVHLKRGEGAAIHGPRGGLFRPKAWPAEKIERATRTIALRRAAEVRRRITAFEGRQQQLRAQHRARLKNFLQQDGRRTPEQRRLVPNEGGRRLKVPGGHTPNRAYGKP